MAVTECRTVHTCAVGVWYDNDHARRQTKSKQDRPCTRRRRRCCCCQPAECVCVWGRQLTAPVSARFRSTHLVWGAHPRLAALGRAQVRPAAAGRRHVPRLGGRAVPAESGSAERAGRPTDGSLSPLPPALAQEEGGSGRLGQRGRGRRGRADGQ